MILSLLSLAFAVRPQVVVILSDELQPYEAPVPAFTEAVGVPVQTINIHGRESEAMVELEALRVADPKVVFALGAKAAWAVRTQMPNTPLIYASVLDPERYGIPGPQVTGIRAQVPPVTFLSQVAAFFPNVKSVGVLRSTEMADEDVEALKRAANDVGLTLSVERVENARGFRRAFNELAELTDAVWIAPARGILTPDGFRGATEEMKRRRKPLLVQTDNMVTAGGAFAVTPNPDGVGRQAAALALEILGGAAPSILQVADPEELSTSLNLRTVEQGQIAYESLMVDFANRVIQP